MPDAVSFELISPVSLGAVSLLLAVAVVLCLLGRRVSGPPAAIARRAGLFTLRALVVLTLLAMLLNPVRVERSPGELERPDPFYLLDASQSMRLGERTTRWDDVVATIRRTDELLAGNAPVRANLFRFGQRLQAIEPQKLFGPESSTVAAQPATANAPSANAASPTPFGPTDGDTQLAPALRQLSSRFGRAPPAGVVLFSDGQSRDSGDAERIAGHFAKLNVPIHVVPVGDTTKGGDIALVGVIAPDRTRKHAQVDVQVFLRSFGYDGRRCELEIAAMGDGDAPPRKLASLPLTLRSGIQSASLSFQSDAQTRRLQISIPTQSDEISADNNKFATEIIIDRTKIRVLYVEGNANRLFPVLEGNTYTMRGPYSVFQKALTEDPDIECVVLAAVPGTGRMVRVSDQQAAGSERAFPATIAELAAYDAIVLSNVTRDTFTDKQLEWIDQWIGKRGGGLCMVGGPSSFASGGWRDSIVEKILPVELLPEGDDWGSLGLASVQPALSATPHPIWHIVADQKQNRDIIRSFPAFPGTNLLPRAKANLATVLATTAAAGQSGDPPPVFAVGQYGKGRSMAFSGAITLPWAGEFVNKWGDGDNRYYAKFWRNAIYWLTESSSIGRRRLIAAADKRFYRPGETIALSAIAYDEGANRTTDYRVVAMIEPQTASSDADSAHSPVRWPNGLARTSGEEGPCIAWGEEFELQGKGGKDGYALPLPIVEALASGSSTQTFRVELTAYEESTQVDSTSMDIQVLHDPFEQQNPLPNHELLRQIASASGGQVLPDAPSLAGLIKSLPVKIGPPQLRKSPVWSRWWLVVVLLGLLTVEWLWRRRIGLA